MDKRNLKMKTRLLISFPLTLEWTEIGMDKKVTVRDVWKKEELGSVKKKISLEIRTHETLLYSIHNYNTF